MFTLLLALPLALPAAFQDSKPVDPQRIESAVTELDTAFKTGKSEDRVRAIRASFEVLDGKVIDGIGRGLRDSDDTVRRAAVEALGRMRHPRALEVLHGFVRASREALQKDEELFPATLRAIARHGSPSSIEILIDDPFSMRSNGAIRARVLGLGNIRSEKAVEALFDLMKKVGLRRADNYMDEIRLALVHLTGEDQGKDPEMWNKWWRDQKHYKLPEAPPVLTKLDQIAWNTYWDIRPDKRDRKPYEKRENGEKEEKP